METTSAPQSTGESPMNITACGSCQDMKDILLKDGDLNPADNDVASKDSLRQTDFKDDLQARAPQSNTESPMTITAHGPSQYQVKFKKKSGHARLVTTPRSKVRKKK